jgi:hypothetical protein
MSVKCDERSPEHGERPNTASVQVHCHSGRRQRVSVGHMEVLRSPCPNDRLSTRYHAWPRYAV